MNVAEEVRQENRGMRIVETGAKCEVEDYFVS